MSSETPAVRAANLEGEGLLVVMTNAVPGRDDEFNAWYSQHMGHILERLEGFVAARRFRLVELPDAPASPYRYMALYEVSDLTAAAAAFAHQGRHDRAAFKEGREPILPGSGSLATDNIFHAFFAPVTDRLVGD